jgi:protein-disulfide isomerase
MSDLSHQSGASQGPADAPVTLVEFSDFQCPFCRNFSVVLKEVLATDRDRIRVVFHHMPLSMHAWARTAAEGAACAQLQNSASFWAIHDKLFETQREITASNVREKLLAFAHETRTLDVAAFQTCLDNQLSLGLVFQDLDLASTAQVSGTPTVFLNGRRLTGVKDAAALRAAVVEASTLKAFAERTAARP